MNELPVLDKGYVRVVNATPNADLAVVNAARASYRKESTELSERDIKLIQYLARNQHTSPFRHAFVTFEVKAPLMVARQWWKYVVGSDHTMDGWNEQSGRYVTQDLEFYIPSEWRAQAKDSKQGSDGLVGSEVGRAFTRLYEDAVGRAYDHYQAALDEGIAAEQARLFLPANAQYTTWRWTASIQSVCHFLNQRLEHDAQWEIRQYAQAVGDLCTELFPVSLAALTGKQEDGND